jgi:hypothetical protein
MSAAPGRCVQPGVDHELLRQLLGAAIRAPTGDNCQPWRFRWDGSTLLVMHEESRGRHAFNRNNHASWLSLGCLLEGLDLAAGRHGLRTRTELTAPNGGLAAPWASITFGTSGAQVDPLADALEQRCTDRRPYRREWLPAGLVDALTADGQSSATARLHLAQNLSEPFGRYVVEGDEIVMRSELAHRDLMKWLRFSSAEAVATRDGMPWWTFASYGESRVLKLCRSYSVQRFANRLGFVSAYKRNSRRLLAASSAIGLVTVETPGFHSLVEAGRLFLRSWLRLSLAGYGFQPLTLPSLSVYDFATGAIDGDTPEQFRRLYAGGRQLLQREFAYDAERLPVWMFRTGPVAPPNWTRTYRLDLDGILELEGAGRA